MTCLGKARRDVCVVDPEALEELRSTTVEAVQIGQRVEVVAVTQGLRDPTVFGGWSCIVSGMSQSEGGL